MDTHYTFDTAPNSYFNGTDLRVHHTPTGEVAIINERENYLAVNVKDHSTMHHMPADVRAAYDLLGEDRIQALYNRQQEEYWREMDETAREHGFTGGVLAAGRSGGWLAVVGTEHYDGNDLIDPSEDDADVRDRFLRFAFAAVVTIPQHLEMFYNLVRDDLTDEQKRLARLIDCPNCDQKIDPETPAEMEGRNGEPGHGEHCIVAVIASVLLDRDHEPKDIDLSALVAIDIWDKFGGPMVDWAAREMGIPTHPNPAEGDVLDKLRAEGLDPSSMTEREINDAFKNLTEPRFGEVSVQEFKGDADGNMPEGTHRLDRIEHNTDFEDAAGRFFKCVGYGPVQGSVEIEDSDGIHAYYDCATRVRGTAAA